MMLEAEDYRSRTRRDEIEARLLAAADKLLGEGESYTEISVERLASEADLSRSTFYVYFDDKGDLLRSWLAQILAQVRDAANPWWAMGPQSTRADLREALSAIITTYRPHARDDGGDLRRGRLRRPRSRRGRRDDARATSPPSVSISSAARPAGSSARACALARPRSG